MARVITFSRYFQKDHPKTGTPTYFVEQIYNSLYEKNNLIDYPKGLEINDHIRGIKKHTIRAGSRWKTGDYFSPRVWSEKPYSSPQITIAPDIQIKRLWDIEIKQLDKIVRWYLNGTMICELDYNSGEHWNIGILIEMAKNDGLELEDFLDWFKVNHLKYKKFQNFKGQIIGWTENIQY